MSYSNTYIKQYMNEEVDIEEFIHASRAQWIPDNTLDQDEKNSHRKNYNYLEGQQTKNPAYEDQDYQAESVRRAKKMLKWLILNNVTSRWRFLTLTYGENGCRDREIITRDIEHMVEKIEKYTHTDIQYICVLEYHRDGERLHAHILLEIPYFRNEDFQACFWPHGFTKIEKIKSKTKLGNIFSVMKYIMKYMTKQGSEALKGKKRYMSSRNLIRRPNCHTPGCIKYEVLNHIIIDKLNDGYELESHYNFTFRDINYTMDLIFKKKETPS